MTNRPWTVTGRAMPALVRATAHQIASTSLLPACGRMGEALRLVICFDPLGDAGSAVRGRTLRYGN